jgi:hypothetical protein
MFGRRKLPFGASPPSPPPPPGGKEPFPIEKMDSALEGAIRLFTHVLDSAGVDAGELAIRGAVPEDVSSQLAACNTYRGEPDGSLSYLALGVTRDFKAFMYPPHCRLYFILNSTGVCEDRHVRQILPQVAPFQLPPPMIDAHMMRAWVKHIVPTGAAMRGGDSALEAVLHALLTDLAAVARRVPAAWAKRVDVTALVREWASGWPGTIGRPLTADVPRMNGLPMTPFISELLTQELARLQAEGISEQRQA